MAKITLKDLSHSYLSKQSSDADWALRGVDIDWKDGGAYALLGPSGCGKTTLLNIISGLLKPTKGEILFDDPKIERGHLEVGSFQNSWARRSTFNIGKTNLLVTEIFLESLYA